MLISFYECPHCHCEWSERDTKQDQDCPRCREGFVEPFSTDEVESDDD